MGRQPPNRASQDFRVIEMDRSQPAIKMMRRDPTAPTALALVWMR
jgi:hypothetical protein